MSEQYTPATPENCTRTVVVKGKLPDSPELDRLRALNKELVEALEALLADYDWDTAESVDKARAVLAKARKEQLCQKD